MWVRQVAPRLSVWQRPRRVGLDAYQLPLAKDLCTDPMSSPG
jgi:hypothetical protein